MPQRQLPSIIDVYPECGKGQLCGSLVFADLDPSLRFMFLS